MEQELFNKEALQELSSPEKLDQQVKLMGKGTWAIVAAILLAAVSTVVWLFLGIITSGHDFDGVIFDHNNIRRLNTSVDGIIQDILVKEGDNVSTGDIIAVISNEKIEEKIRQLNEEKSTLEEDSEQYREVERKIRSETGKLILLSGCDGEVQSIALRDSAVRAGDCVATIVPAGSYNEVYVFVPKEDAGIFQVGMKAQITPSFVTREEYGYIEGMISDISDTLVTENSIIRHMGTMDYVDGLIPSKNSVQITIQLNVESGEEGNYLWSSEEGKELTIRSGDQCRVRILKKEYHPIEILLKK